MSPDDARAAVKKVTGAIEDAQAVGDLDGLLTRLEALTPLVAQQRERRKAERAAKVEEARSAKTKIATEAETIAAGTDWRHGVTRLRELLDEWKALPRLDKSSDDELWHRFSSARTTYTRHRKQHFAELSSKREEAAVVKERLAAEAETLASSNEWGPTSGRFRDLMRQWKAAGPAPREVDDKLWARFRAAQDLFFGARDAVQAEENAEQVDNLRGQGSAAGRDRDDPAGLGREVGPRAAPGLPGPLGPDRQGPARLDARHRRPPACRRAGREGRRGRGLEPQQPRGPRPRRGHGQATPVLDLRPGEAGQPSSRPRATPARPPRPEKPSPPAENG